VVVRLTSVAEFSPGPARRSYHVTLAAARDKCLGGGQEENEERRAAHGAEVYQRETFSPAPSLLDMRTLSIVLTATLVATATLAAEPRLRLLDPPTIKAISAGGCTATSFMWFTTGYDVWLFFDCPDTRWWVLARNTDRGLEVGPAVVRRMPPSGPWISVLKSAHVAEIFTPYHTGGAVPAGVDDRPSDMQSGTSDALRALDTNDLGPVGMLVQTPEKQHPTIAVELRDRGIAWMCKSDGQSHTRRGMDMVVWADFDGGNYENIIEYTFRDDGQISFRVGWTGWNNVKVGTDVAHMHDALWRVEMALGNGANTPSIWSHQELGLAAVDTETPFNAGREGTMDLAPLLFATLIIEDELTNAAGHRIGYELQPVRVGSARHNGPTEKWTQHDTWITRQSATELAVANSTTNWMAPDTYLVGDASNMYGVFNQESVEKQALVLWHVTSAHHEPHDEDQASGDPSHGHKGLTLMHWSGFDLVPHNLFDVNPLGAPHRDLCDGPI
jgi:primary-amine oxidase